MADQQQPQEQGAGGLDLPPGFRFHPSDFEIVNYYLTNKVHDEFFTCTAIGEVELNKTEPWDLPDRAKWGKKEWYFFYKKDRKYPTGLRANRATKAGYWKATGKDKEVYDTTEGVMRLVGMKKTLVFYQGRAPRGDKTNWVMHEYRLEGSDKIPGPASAPNSFTNAAMAMKDFASASKDEWAVCRVFQKTNGIKKTTAPMCQVAMAGTEIQQNQNNIPTISIPMSLQLSLPMPMQQFSMLPDFIMDPVAPYYPNTGVAMPPMMPPMAGIGGAGGLQINDTLFGNPKAMLPQTNFYHQMGMGAPASQMGKGAIAGQMDMMGIVAGQMGMGAAIAHMDMGAAVAQMDIGAVGTGGFNIVAAESSPPSSMVSQKDELVNVADISSMMSVTSPGSAVTILEMDGRWKYKH